MLGLKLKTDPFWAKLAEENLEAAMVDHAWCEQKAATNAITLIVNNCEHHDLVVAMIDLATEELSHFKLVYEKLTARGFKLTPETKNNYVNELLQFVRRGHARHIVLIDRLLFAAMIEARSCERFKTLSENVKDPELKQFYKDLMISEANHYTTFIKFARRYSQGEDVDARWEAFLAYEASVIVKYGLKENIHG